MSKVIRFVVNNKQCEVEPGTDLNTRLVDYLRNGLNLRGTKYMCREGGCGACVVQVCARNPATGIYEVFSVNSCLVLLYSCDGWQVTTVEGLGSNEVGYHQIQRVLAERGGSQCGFCSPGMVMSMSSLQNSRKKLTEKQIENSFGSNICRCTGYRPILDAFKTFAVDYKDSEHDIADIESLDITFSKMKCKSMCKDKELEEWCLLDAEDNLKYDTFVGAKQKQVWYKPNDIESIFHILNNIDDSYMLIAGNTSSGIYPIKKYPSSIIDLSGVDELKSYYFDVNLVLGANMTLTNVMDLFLRLSRSDENFEYLKIMHDHLDKVAHLPVRNIGTLAGNLMTKYNHNEFPSDIFLLFETVGATLTIRDSESQTFELNLQQFIRTNMKKKLIVAIQLPPVSLHLYKLRTFKIMSRSQHALALVNAGIFFKFNPLSLIINAASLVFGNINPKFVHAIQTEKFLRSRNIFDDKTLLEALRILNQEIDPDECPPKSSPGFRKILALNLFYKAILDLAPSNLVNKRKRSGGNIFKRPVSHGTQVYDTNKSLWPLNQPLPKVEALAQCSGEARYINDMDNMRNETYAALVYTTVTTGRIRRIDPSEALNIEGVIAFYKASDIPGDNNFTPVGFERIIQVEEIFCSGKVLYCGQPLGVIVANTEAIANSAAGLVKVEYDDMNRNLIISVHDALNSPDVKDRVTLKDSIDPTERGNKVDKVFKGNFSTPFGQYHFSMEPHTCIAVPTDDGMNIYPSTQYPDIVHVSVAKALQIPQNRIHVKVDRVGGAYGVKLTRSTQLAAACALVAYRLRRPCRAVASLSTMMNVFGKRTSTYAEYEVGVNQSGEIQYLDLKVYKNKGAALNDNDADLTSNPLKSCYDSSRWRIRVYNVRTDITPSTFCRSPGSLEAIALAENIMERISYELKLSHISVRLSNMIKDASKFQTLFKSFLSNVKYVERQKSVQAFNTQNRWIKRGLSAVPMNWSLHYFGTYSVIINVYHGDGTVIINHSGVEIGQGINTKVIQVCAYTLGIPVAKIKVVRINSDTLPNVFQTANSMASESVCYATIQASNILLDRLAPIKRMNPNATWLELIEAAQKQNVNLQSTFFYKEGQISDYSIWGVTLAEVELDLLTGNHQVIKIDLQEDIGQSLNPALDVGQLEGAFVMGLGHWTCENLIYKEGKLLTTNALNYQLPLCKDIPIDFGIYFLRNSYNVLGVLGSKTTGEPATCLAVAVPHALRAAITSSRIESGYGDGWFHIDAPYTNENMLLAAQVKLEEMTLK